MLRDSRCGVVAKGLSGKGSRQSSWQCQPQTRAKSTAQFAFALHALDFTPGALGMEMVAQGLFPLGHITDLPLPGKHQRE